jgi:hypothetical protein
MRTLVVIWLLFASATAHAVTAVNPFGVNVRSSGPTTVFLTFQNLNAGETAVDAFWCGELNSTVMAGNPTLQLPFAVQSSDPCVPGTIYGRLPVRNDRSRQSNSGAFTNLTDVMTIPASVARRAYQDAQAGRNSAFFYVRRFITGGVDAFVIVTCRMAGGGARVPLALLDVRIAFEDRDRDAPVVVVARDSSLPSFSANIAYNGGGTLKGRWEVMMPGDVEPNDEDLLTEATLPVERRALQRRYTLVERFEVFLPPTGRIDLPGPSPDKLPTAADGPYKVLLRIEASGEKESDSNTGGGRIAHAGGVAGFPMPVLRYYVGSPDLVSNIASSGALAALTLFAPDVGAQFAKDQSITFSWLDFPGTTMYRLEVAHDNEEVLSALVKPDAGRYAAPPWLAGNHTGKTLRWRVIALDERGNARAQSRWREFILQ